jgi:NDP-sugar pyrophosphorylase family protein
MQAVILAGGLGTRLRSVVSDRPKPMAQVGGRPFLEYLIERVRDAGCEEVILSVGYRHEQIVAHFGDGAGFGVPVRYAVEETPLGTGGALKNAEPWLRGRFFGLNGDTFCDFDPRSLLDAHEAYLESEPACLGTLALLKDADSSAYGQVMLDERGRIVAFREKTECVRAPRAGDRVPLVSAGVYVLERAILERIPAGRAVSLEREVFPGVTGDTGALFGFVAEGSFIDIGTPEGYRRFERLKGKQ